MAHAFCVQAIRHTVLTDYVFKESPLSENIPYAYERWLFHHAKHLHLQSSSGWHSFYAINNAAHTIDAHLHVHIAGSRAISPYRAPFGSYQFREDISYTALFEFIEFTLARLHEKGVNEFVVKNPPLAYAPGVMELLTTFQLNLGFEIQQAEAGSILDISGDFREGLNSGELRRIKKAEKEGLKFTVLDMSELESIYTFILACRMERGYTLSIDWETLRKTVEAFPDRYMLFGVRHHDVVAAAAIAYDAGNRVLVNFHPAHPREYDHLSPVVLLLEGMYHYAHEKGYRLLDLGTSAVDGKPNFGLLNFKSRVGARVTSKFTLVKRW